jgi:hypothetical protein
MKQKLIIGAGLVFLLVLFAVMSYDLFLKKDDNTANQYEYNLEKFKQVDSNLICYHETSQIKPNASKLYGIAIDKMDKIFITSDKKLLIYNRNGDSIQSFNIPDKAGCIAAGAKGMLYLGFKNHLEIWNSTGKLIKRWDDISGIPYVTGIAVDDSSVFVADAGNKIVYHFNMNGQLINQIGRKDPAKGIPGLFIPSPYFDVLIGQHNEIWVINTGRHSFESYTKDGELISIFTKTAMTIDGFSGCCNPTNVAMLSDGSFVTSEKGIERVKIHSANGDFKCVVAAPNLFKEGTTGLDLAVDSKDRIFVLDPEKGMVRIFEKN